MQGVNHLFVDTNILIFATNSVSPWHQAAVDALQGARGRGVELVVSPQILREYLAAATRPGSAGETLPLDAILANVRTFQACERKPPRPGWREDPATQIPTCLVPPGL
jgi:predicted nucleic acid-binding protein